MNDIIQLQIVLKSSWAPPTPWDKGGEEVYVYFSILSTNFCTFLISNYVFIIGLSFSEMKSHGLSHGFRRETVFRLENRFRAETPETVDLQSPETAETTDFQPRRNCGF